MSGSDNSSKVPVRFIEGNQELLKSMGTDYSSVKGKTDYINDVHANVEMARIEENYRTPTGRVNGNELFRRYLDGRLDIKYAVHKVVDALHKYREHAVPLYTQELVALQILFPEVISDGLIDPSMVSAVAGVNVKITPQERELIRIKVASHIAEEINWNAGMGGGSVPGRHQTRA